MIRPLIVLALTLLLAAPAAANPALEAVIADNLDQIEKPSRRTVEPRHSKEDMNAQFQPAASGAAISRRLVQRPCMIRPAMKTP